MYCNKLFNTYDHFHMLWHLPWPTLDYTMQKANFNHLTPQTQQIFKVTRRHLVPPCVPSPVSWDR